VSIVARRVRGLPLIKAQAQPSPYLGASLNPNPNRINCGTSFSLFVAIVAINPHNKRQAPPGQKCDHADRLHPTDLAPHHGPTALEHRRPPNPATPPRFHIRHPTRQQPQPGSNRNSKTAPTRNPAPLRRINANAPAAPHTNDPDTPKPTTAATHPDADNPSRVPNSAAVKRKPIPTPNQIHCGTSFSLFVSIVAPTAANRAHSRMSSNSRSGSSPTISASPIPPASSRSTVDRMPFRPSRSEPA